MKTATTPQNGPKTKPESKIKAFCNTIGTGEPPIGITTYAPTEINAAKSEASTGMKYDLNSFDIIPRRMFKSFSIQAVNIIPI